MSIRPRDRIALGVILFLAGIGAYYMLALKPQQQKAASLQSAIASQRSALAQAQQSFTTGRAARASLKANAAQWAALKLAVPAQSDIPALLRTLERNAKAAHVHMQSITLSGASASSSTPSSTAGGGSSTGSTTGAAVSNATGVPVQLTFQGGYAALNRLVQQLDSFVVVSGSKVHASGPLMSISSVSLNGGQGLTVQLTTTIYQLDPPTAAGSTGATTATTTPTTGG